MKKAEVLAKIKDCGVVAVVRADSANEAFGITEACIQAGIYGIEITYTVPGATQIIRELAARYQNSDVIVGAGTVLDPETARDAILAGAQFVVSPCLNVETMRLCSRYGVPVMPGAMTVKEVVECLEAGADIIKVFPGNLLGFDFIRSMKGPLPQAEFMPTGGVNEQNIAEWIKAGAVAVGVGGDLTSGAKRGDFESIVTIGRKLTEAVKAARTK